MKVFESKTTKKKLVMKQIALLLIVILISAGMVLSSGNNSHLILLLIATIPIISLYNILFQPSNIEHKKSYNLLADQNKLTITDINDNSENIELGNFEVVIFVNGQVMLVNQANKKVSHKIYKRVRNYAELEDWLSTNMKVVRSVTQSEYFNY
ncbi:hypothetical protein [Ekhidna sp.]